MACGFLIGAEREMGKESGFGGARTFPLYALSGGLGMLLGPWALIGITLSISILLGVAYVRDSSNLHMGMSTEMAAIITFALGALCTARELPLSFADRLLLAAAGATATLGLLSIKRVTRKLVSAVSLEEIYATVKLLLLAVIVLPLLPDRNMGPWESLNPRSIGVLVVLISAIGFVGYVAVRALGARQGLLITGLLGGLASSTAVTLSLSARARTHVSLAPAYAVAIVLASSTMFVRLLLELYTVSPQLADRAAVPLLSAALAGAITAFLFFRRLSSASKREGVEGAPPTVKNPLALASAIKFAFMFTVILVASRAASYYFKETGAYLAAFISGFANTDAAALSLGRLQAAGGLRMNVALDGVGIAAATNTLSKIFMAHSIGGPAVGRPFAFAMFVALAAGFGVRLLTAVYAL